MIIHKFGCFQIYIKTYLINKRTLHNNLSLHWTRMFPWQRVADLNHIYGNLPWSRFCNFFQELLHICYCGKVSQRIELAHRIQMQFCCKWSIVWFWIMPSAVSSGHCPPLHQIYIVYDQTKLHHWAVCLKGNTLYIIRTGQVYLNKQFFFTWTKHHYCSGGTMSRMCTE